MRLTDSIAALVDRAAAAQRSLPQPYSDHGSPFDAADALTVFAELRKYAALDRAFLEWGSGIGTATIMADLLGFRAYGIEFDPVLVDASRRLATEFNSDARFAHGNFIPADALAAARKKLLGRPSYSNPWLALDGPDGYADLGLNLDSFDLIYVFPWPRLIDFHHQLFARHAKVGARLLVYSETMDVLESTRTDRGCTPLKPA